MPPANAEYRGRVYRARRQGATDETAVTKSRFWSKDWQYFAFCIACWCFVPELRRVLDWRSGSFSSVQILSLLPLLSVVPLFIWVLKKERLARLSPTLKTFAIVWMLANTYALVIGSLFGNLAAALYSYISFVIPLIAGLWIATQLLSPAETLRRTATIIVGLVGIVGIYGVIQFVFVPPWDAFWVIGARMDSIGTPAPFMMRVFSTINSQGVCAEVLAIALLYGLSTRNLPILMSLPLLAAVAGSLVLTLVRSSWVGLVVGVVAYLILSPRRLKVAPIVMIFVGLIAFFVVALPSLLGDSQGGGGGQQIVERMNTFNDLGQDPSALDRQSEISVAFEAGNRNPLGVGLGQLGPAAKLSNANGGDAVVLDSGYLSRFSELGYLGFAAYLFVVVGTLVIVLLRVSSSGGRCNEEDRNALALAGASCIMMMTLEIGGDTYVSIIGVFAWLAIGLGFNSSFNGLWSRTVVRKRIARPQITT